MNVPRPPPAKKSDDSLGSDESTELDTLLRHLSRSMPSALVRAFAPGARFRGWEDTQLTSRQRRMDRCFLVQRGVERVRIHVEWQTEWTHDVPFRVFEYQVLDVLAAHETEAAQTLLRRTSTARVSIESHVVLLTGRETPWPTQMEFRMSPEGAPFAGIRFHVHAVYQRTVTELMALGPLFAIFLPLARDASADQAPGWLRYLRKAALSKARYADLASAMAAIARVDPRQRQLEQVILSLLPEDIQMNNAIYNLGLGHGRKQGLEKGRRETIVTVCGLLGIEVSSERQSHLDSLALVDLEALLSYLTLHHAWPKS